MPFQQTPRQSRRAASPKARLSTRPIAVPVLIMGLWMLHALQANLGLAQALPPPEPTASPKTPNLSRPSPRPATATPRLQKLLQKAKAFEPLRDAAYFQEKLYLLTEDDRLIFLSMNEPTRSVQLPGTTYRIARADHRVSVIMCCTQFAVFDSALTPLASVDNSAMPALHSISESDAIMGANADEWFVASGATIARFNYSGHSVKTLRLEDGEANVLDALVMPDGDFACVLNPHVSGGQWFHVYAADGWRKGAAYSPVNSERDDWGPARVMLTGARDLVCLLDPQEDELLLVVISPSVLAIEATYRVKASNPNLLSIDIVGLDLPRGVIVLQGRSAGNDPTLVWLPMERV